MADIIGGGQRHRSAVDRPEVHRRTKSHPTREHVRGIEGEQVLLRVILSESHMVDGKPLHRRILEILRQEGLAGATVLNGLAGFGHDRRMHTTAIEVAAEGLPVAVEVVDTQAHLDHVLPMIDALLGRRGVMTLERARVIRYEKTSHPR